MLRASRDLPTSLEPSSLIVGEAGDFKCLRDPPQAPCLRRPGLFLWPPRHRYNAIQRLPLGAHASHSRIGSRPTLGCEAQALHAMKNVRGQMARAGPFHRGGGGGSGLPASAATGTPHAWASVSTARAAFHASGLGRCDRRHKLFFEYPIIFWTPRDL